jgi:hypothetical protein
LALNKVSALDNWNGPGKSITEWWTIQRGNRQDSRVVHYAEKLQQLYEFEQQ